MLDFLDTSNNLANPRPSWDEYFIEIAFVASKRSHDPQTKHGSVIVNKENIIMGVGYNGFPKGRDELKLCNVRPGKYLLINHAEANAIANCLVKPKVEDKARCYISGFPCIDCVKQLYLNNIKTIIHADRQGSAIFTAEYWQQWFAVVEYLGMDIRRLPPTKI
mgnify:CR=1 FL=1